MRAPKKSLGCTPGSQSQSPTITKLDWLSLIEWLLTLLFLYLYSNEWNTFLSKFEIYTLPTTLANTFTRWHYCARIHVNTHTHSVVLASKIILFAFSVETFPTIFHNHHPHILLHWIKRCPVVPPSVNGEHIVIDFELPLLKSQLHCDCSAVFLCPISGLTTPWHQATKRPDWPTITGISSIHRQESTLYTLESWQEIWLHLHVMFNIVITVQHIC